MRNIETFRKRYYKRFFLKKTKRNEEKSNKCISIRLKLELFVFFIISFILKLRVSKKTKKSTKSRKLKKK